MKPQIAGLKLSNAAYLHIKNITSVKAVTMKLHLLPPELHYFAYSGLKFVSPLKKYSAQVWLLKKNKSSHLAALS